MRGGDAPAAEELYRRVAEIREQRYGFDHPAYLKALGNVAMILARQKRFEEAEVVGRQHVTALRRVLGEEHPEYATTLSNLALLVGIGSGVTFGSPIHHNARRNTGRPGRQYFSLKLATS